jgi:hypothetical protein
MAGHTAAVLRKEAALLAIYEKAEADLMQLIEADAKAGTRPGTKAYREKRLALIRQLLSDTQDAAIPLSTELISFAYEAGATTAAQQMSTAIPNFGAGVHQGAIELLADSMANGLNGAAEQVGRYVDDFYRQLGLDAATEQIAQGGTRRAASQSLIDAIKRRGITSFVDASGTRWKLSRYAQMVVRTNTSQAVVKANINTALEQGFDLVEVLVVPDEQLCEICGPYADKTFTLTDRAGYETLDEEPPFHPNCRCDLNILTTDPRADE